MYKEFCKRVTVNKKFEFAITAVILLNSFLIGVETYTENQTIKRFSRVYWESSP